MNAQQKLADIYALVAYIKEHIDENPIRNENQQLDEIGKTTLAISEMLQMLEQKTGVQTNEEFGEYRRALGDITKTIYDQLVTIKSLLDDNGQKTTELYDKIEEVYTTYVGILKESSEKLELQNNRYSQEAHNLVDRASSMYSATLYKEDFLAVKRLVMPYSKKLARSLESCNRELLELKKKCPEHGYQILNDIGVLYLKLLHLHTTMEAFLEDYKQIPERKKILEFYFALTTFLNIADLIDDSYVIYDELKSDGRFMVRLYCVHPANNLKLCLDKGVSTVFFSATILPVKYYMEMLSDTVTDQAIYIPSPFDPEKRQIMVGVDVSTKYTRRSVKEYKRVAEYIRQLFNAHSGNYMVFLPSYKMLQEVYEQMIEGDCSGMELLCQEQNMKEADREAFLDHFSAKRNVVAFCIMGGIFSEGIDLTGERLIGSVVVGPGLPQVCNERKIMMDYFNARKSMEAYAGSSVDGFKYAYLYPGINKVFQSAGRVIRTEADAGVILLLDERFGTGEYNSLFPVEWQDAVFGNFDQISQSIEQFWSNLNLS